MKMFSKDGIEMMDIHSLEMEGNKLIIKGKMMRSMPATIYLRPEEMIGSFKLLSWGVVMGMPVMLLQGLWLTLKRRMGGEKKS